MAGQPITLTLPSIGDPATTSATQITTALTTLETELERKVVPADMSMSADLSFLVASTNYRVKDLLASSYVLNAAALSATTYPRSVYTTGTDGDLYFNDGANRQIQLTASGALNVASTGAITSTGAPAYGASGVTVRWDGADLEYEMRSGSGANDYADIRLDDVIFNDGSANFLRLTAQAMASDYTITFPAAVPASTSVVQMSSAGTLTASPSGNIATSGTVATGALTVTGAATVSTTLGVTSNATVGGTLGVTGIATVGGLAAGASGITSANNIVAAVDVHMVVSGLGRFKHGALIKNLGVSWGDRIKVGSPTHGTVAIWTAAAAGDTIEVAFPMVVGERITGFTVYGYDNGAGTFFRGNLVRVDMAAGTTTVVGGNADSGVGTTGNTSASVSGLTETVSAGYSYSIRWEAGAASDLFYGIAITYDRP